MKPPKPTNKSLYDLTEKEKRGYYTAKKLLEAVDAFAADKLTKKVFSEAMITILLDINMMSGLDIIQQQLIGKSKNI